MATTATYAQYPTPPPTGSPKDHDTSSYQLYSQQPEQAQKQPETQMQNQPRPSEAASYFNPAISFSAPGSPSHPPNPRWEGHSNPLSASTPQIQTSGNEYVPPRRRSSPTATHRSDYKYGPPPPQQDIYYNPGESSSTIKPIPPRRRSSPGVSPNTTTSPKRSPRLPPRPLHYSPKNPIPTPFNVSRPLPRPGLLRRMLNKLKGWAKGFIRWCRSNPIKASLLAFLPMLAGAAVVSAFTSAAKVLGQAGILLLEGMGGGKEPGYWNGKKEEAKDKIGDKIADVKDQVKGAKADAKKAAEEQAAEWGYGIDDFKGIGGSKGGPIEGFLKVMQMMVNHYCKLTPSAVPRAFSILLELYFLDQIKSDGGI